MQTDQNTSYDWDQPPIDKPQEGGGENTLLPPGVYPFTVLSFARGRYEPGPNAKLPPCNKAIVKVRVDGGDLGSFTKDVNLFLHSRCEGILAAFFAALGLRKHGEPLHMQWTRIVGRGGHVKTKHVQGTGDKADKSYNEIAAWMYPDDVKTDAPAAPEGDTNDEVIPF